MPSSRTTKLHSSTTSLKHRVHRGCQICLHSSTDHGGCNPNDALPTCPCADSPPAGFASSGRDTANIASDDNEPAHSLSKDSQASSASGTGTARASSRKLDDLLLKTLKVRARALGCSWFTDVMGTSVYCDLCKTCLQMYIQELYSKIPFQSSCNA